VSAAVAKLVRRIDDGSFRGDARLYRCEGGELPEYVVVSAVTTLQVGSLDGPETYIFPADADGKVTRWFELVGSQKDTLDHAKALRDAGYEVAS
jgi:hypothetical protein